MTVRTASCSCGHLTVHCAGEPQKVSLCHCLDCQKRTGSVFGIAAFYDRTNIDLKGEASTYKRESDSGHPVTFHFCSKCGSTVYWEPARLPDVIAVAVGAFADPGFPAPDQEVYEKRRHPWARCAHLEGR